MVKNLYIFSLTLFVAIILSPVIASAQDYESPSVESMAAEPIPVEAEYLGSPSAPAQNVLVPPVINQTVINQAIMNQPVIGQAATIPQQQNIQPYALQESPATVSIAQNTQQNQPAQNQLAQNEAPQNPAAEDAFSQVPDEVIAEDTSAQAPETHTFPSDQQINTQQSVAQQASTQQTNAPEASPRDPMPTDVSFEAYMDRDSVGVGETFQMKIELINADPVTAPDVSKFPSELRITNQTSSQSMTIINGQQMSNISWILDVVASSEGTINIPEISIETRKGTLYTKSTKIFVKSASEIGATTSDNSVFIEASLEKKEALVDEPVLYKLRIYNLGQLLDTELTQPKSDNATIEQISEAKPSRQILNGINYKMIEVDYMVTPLKEGVVEIEPSVMNGKIVKSGSATPSALDTLFSTLGGAVINAKEVIPFTVASKRSKLSVKPVESSVNPWIALYDLKIDDELLDVVYDDATKRINAKAGEPITRKIRMSATGKGGEALPELEKAFSNSEFKIYADKPETTKEVVPGEGPLASRIKGTKTQTFTFIPQKAGMLTLPELNIDYWSLKDDKVAKATLPGKVITSVPSDRFNANQEKTAATQPQETKSHEALAQETLENRLEELTGSKSSNIMILLLAFCITVIIFMSFKLLSQAKTNRENFDEEIMNYRNIPDKAPEVGVRKIIDDSMQNMPNNMSRGNMSAGRRRPIVNTPPSAASEPASQKPAGDFMSADYDTPFSSQVRTAKTYKDLQFSLQQFAVKRLNVAKNAATVIIAVEISKKLGVDRNPLVKVATELDSALYAGKQPELEPLRKAFADAINKLESKHPRSSKNDDDIDDLVALNP